MSVHVLGIRHHGPGSARNVKAFLEKTKPDIILIEGPPEGDELLRWSLHSALRPPVAILAYRPDEPQQAVFYPFAEFSPEWQALQFGARNNLPVRFMDLPLVHKMALQQEATSKEPDPPAETSLANAAANVRVHHDPIEYLAEAAGYTDGERWWESMFEHRQEDTEVFEAIREAMEAVRTALPEKEDRIEKLREAHMRKMIRQAEKESFATIAVVCGAWHAPALVNMPKAKEDLDLLKNLPKVKLETTWIPWTYNRLTFESGYGAGIQSPGWYDHVWKHPTDDGTLWMAQVAQLFRKKEMDTSTAHIIEAVRLAEALASLRNVSKVGLEELNEATWSVLCNGDSILLELIRNELIVSDTIGSVPTEIPKPPLLQDVEKLQKKLRLPAEAGIKELNLDLREELHLERSVFLHRLLLIGVSWGHLSHVRGKGTFKEQWQLKWEPEYSIRIIEKGNWGNTLEEATSQFIINQAKESNSLDAVCTLLQQVIPANLPLATEVMIHQIDHLAAASSDTLQLLQALPPLVSISRYGNVRQTDETMILGIVNAMIARVCVGLPPACVSVDDESAQKITEQMQQLNDAISLLNQSEQKESWCETLQIICRHTGTAPLIAGYATRLLADAKIIESEELSNQFYLALSRSGNPSIAAAWVEGFLKGSGTILLLDNTLWNLVNEWIRNLSEEDFIALLPLMRRTFAHFSQAERRKIGEKASQGAATNLAIPTNEANIDHERAMKAMPVVMQLLGIETPSSNGE